MITHIPTRPRPTRRDPRVLAGRPSSSWVGTILISLFLCGSLAGALQEPPSEGAEPPKAAEPPAPTFSDTETEQLFQQGLDHFAKASWKDAEKCFKAVKSKAEREQKPLLDGYLLACKGGPRLEAVEKAIDKANWKQAYRELQKLRPGLIATPLKERLDGLQKTIDEQLFIPLATFEDPAPPAQSAEIASNPNASFNTEARFVRGGERSLRWNARYGGPGGGGFFAQLPLCSFDPAWLADHKTLHISIYSPSKDFGKFTLYFAGPDSLAASGMDILKARCFFHHITVNEEGWIDLQIDLTKEVQTLVGTQWDEIDRIAMLMIPPSKPKSIYLDEIKLEKR